MRAKLNLTVGSSCDPWFAIIGFAILSSDWQGLIGTHQGADVGEIDGGRPVVLSEDERDTPSHSALRRY
jgi:hypothetical protein